MSDKKEKGLPEFEAGLRQVMQEPWGRRVIFTILNATDWDKPHNVSDHADLAFFMGRRSLGLELVDLLKEICPKEYNLGASEELTRAAARATTQEPAEDQNG